MKNINLKRDLRFVLFGLVLVLAAIRRFSLPTVPFADGDLAGYLLPAIDLLEHGELTHFGTRSFLYPLFCAVLIKVTGTIASIAFVQHVLGLLTGVLLFMVFERPMFRTIRNGKWGWLLTALQLGGSAYFLLTNSIWQFEHFITSQALSTFLLMLQLYIIVVLVDKPKADNKSMYLGALAVFLSLVTYMLLPRMGFAMPLVILIVLIELWRAKLPYLKLGATLVVPLGVFVLTMWIPERHLVNKYDQGTDEFPFRQFFYVHADMVKSLMQEDIASGTTEFPIELIEQVEQMLVITPGEGHFPYLGFDADTLFIGGVEVEIQATVEAAGLNYMDVVKHYDGRVLSERTRAYALKVADQLQHYYLGTAEHDKYMVDEQPLLYNVKGMTLDMDSRANMGNGAIMTSYKNMAEQQLTNWQWRSKFGLIHQFIALANFTYIPLLIVFVLQQLYFLLRRRRFSFTYNTIRRYTFYMLLMQLALVLTVAMVHSFDIYRYGVWFVQVGVLVQAFVVVLLVFGKRFRVEG